MKQQQQGRGEEKDKWVSYSIRRAVVERVEDFVSSREDPTITNVSQFIDLALREKLGRSGDVEKKGGVSS